MENGIILRQTVVSSMADVQIAAQAMAKSGYFQDAKDIAQAVVKILAGQEMGFGPFASMTGVYIIQGRPSIGANLMAAAVKSSGRYNYRVAEMSDIVCKIDFYEGKEKIGTSSFTIEEARKAGTKNLDKFPRNMLFARAMSNGCRWYCPDVFSGAPTYTPEELGADVNENGEVIDPAPVMPRLITPEPERTDPAKPQPDTWPQSTVEALAAAWEIPAPRILSTLKHCTLPKDSAPELMAVWITAYKGQRDAGQSVDAAAEYANEETALLEVDE